MSDDDPTVRPGGAVRPVELPPQGYDLGDVIGRGGMGEVLAAHDLRIGRDVALKRMRDGASANAVTRFLREARIQARLDHPAIVPVHELGTDTAGRPFFTMKRLAGVTLQARLELDEPIQPLLRAFVEVCLAIDLAHARGIIHRDLKPANIMLGDFGEVYVIDWGIARELGERDDDLPALATSTGETEVGTVLGTPGYMSPEQLRGEEIGTPCDIYALGAILFEILARDRLHPKGEEALVATLECPTDSPAKRAPARDIPPELDDLCQACLAEDAAARPTARELVDRLRRYIDGDRDLERRRALAAEHIAAAGAASTRAEALRQAGRALALDPESAAAAGLVARLLLGPPPELPPELVASLAEHDRDTLRTRSKRAAASYGMVFTLLVLVPFLDVRSVGWLIGFNVLLAALVTFAWFGARTGRVSPGLSMLGNFALAFAATRIAGPFMLTPVMICGATIAVASHPWNQRHPWTIAVWIAVTSLLPIVLEALGVLGSTWSIENRAFATRSAMFEIRGATEGVALVVANLGFLLLVGSFAYTVTRNAREARRNLEIQAWQLRKLADVPTARTA